MADHSHHGHHQTGTDHHTHHDHNNHGHSHGGTHHDPSQQHQKPQDDEAFTEANRQHWNKFASSYASEQWQRDLLQKTTAFILANIDWIGVDFIDPSTTFESNPTSKPTIRVLDYACGPGTVTHALGSRVTEYVGIDLSENMVKAYNLRFNRDPFPSSETRGGSEDEALNAHAVVGNLLDASGTPASLDGEEFFNFDLVAVAGGYHHFLDISLATSRLVERLKPGGVFLIIDFVTHGEQGQNSKDSVDESKHPAIHTVAHNGFSEDELRGYFKGAGLEEFKIVRMGEEVFLRGLNPREPFMATGRKVSAL